MAALAVFGDDLTAGAGQDLEIDPGLGETRLKRLRHVGEGGRVDDIQRHRDRRFHTRVGEDLLGLFGVMGERRLVIGTGETLRPEGLMHLHLPLDDAVGHALVIDQITRGLPHRRVRQAVGFLVEGQKVDGGLRIGLDLDLIAVHRGDLVRGQVPRHVDIALFQQQLLGRGLGHMADDDAVDGGRALEIVLVRRHADHLRGRIAIQHKGAGPGRVFVQPGIAHVAVLLMLLDHGAVDDRGRA